MKNTILPSGSGQNRVNCLKRLSLMILLGISTASSWAQVTTYEKVILLSGQLTEAVSGAPIADHDIFIRSDSLVNNGFSYYAVTRTDVNGFYQDTIVTTLSDGILNLSLYDFEDHLISLDRYYRFVWESKYQMFVDFSLFDPNSTIDFQANFRAEKDTVHDNPLKVFFRDKSTGKSIKSWEWDFGDGTTSDVQDPEHEYAVPGNYMVTLTIGSTPPGYEPHQRSTIAKQVQVGLTEFHHLGGHVFAELFPIDYGLAYLYGYDADNHLVLIDTTVIDELGYYYFYQLPAGKYVTKARLQGISGLYGQYLPTYFGDVYIWEDAEDIELEKDNWECDIWLLPSLGTSSGTGQIIGQIVYDTLRSSSSVMPAADIEILLLNQNGMLLTCGLSDLEGYFRFAGIDFGTYQLYPDVTGIQTSPMYVTISQDKPTASHVSLVIYPEQITFGTGENASSYLDDAVLVYPNPAYDHATISFEMKKSSGIDILVLDPAGKTVARLHQILPQGPGRIRLDASGFAAGCYQVILIPEDKAAVSARLLKLK